MAVVMVPFATVQRLQGPGVISVGVGRGGEGVSVGGVMVGKKG